MSDDLDPDISRWLADAARQIDPAPDLRSRADANARKHSRTARIGFGVAAALLVFAAGTVAVLSTGHQSDDRWESRPVDEVSPTGPIDWSTAEVAFRADSLVLAVRGMSFGASEERTKVHSDPGTPTYTTLERRWFENGVEMRVNLYFKSDGVEWWSDEIRTYDGAPSRGTTWVTYQGDFFRSPVGQPYVGDLELPGDAQSVDGDGTLTFRGAEILPFQPSSSCSAGASEFSLDVGSADVTIEGDGFTARVELLDSSCEPVSDLSPFEITFVSLNNEVVTSIPTCPPSPDAFAACRARADLRPGVNGRTEVRVDVLRIADGTTIAEGSIDVAVERRNSGASEAEEPTDVAQTTIPG